MFDIEYAFDENNNTVKLDVDITYGDLTGSEFTIDAPNKIECRSIYFIWF
jgi:hypothetical protein